MKKELTILMVFLVLLVSACTVAYAPQQDLSDREFVNVESTVTSEGIKEFTVHGSKFKFTPFELRVKKGDSVRINYISDDIGHNLVIDEFNVRTNIISDGAAETIEFTADKEGTFNFYCSVGNHRALGMEGRLIVEP